MEGRPFGKEGDEGFGVEVGQLDGGGLVPKAGGQVGRGAEGPFQRDLLVSAH
jgi:hypothetical protein